jgi:hypothetical protein
VVEPTGATSTGTAGGGSFAAIRTGRVIQLRVRRLAEVADVDRLTAAVASAIDEAGPGASICADFRGASPLPPEVAKAWSRAMRKMNGSLVRSALLLDPANALFNLQLERVVKCAGNPARRLFPNMADLQQWIAGALEGWERDAVGAFLSEG